MERQIVNLLNRNEIRRLEKAAREKDKKHLVDWLAQIEEQIRAEYENNFKLEVEEAIQHLLIAIAYSLHFSEETRFGRKRLNKFIEDLVAVTEGFKTGDFDVEYYKKQLKEDKIIMFDD